MPKLDRRLVESARRGDTGAFEELLLLYQRAVFALVSALTGENDEAEDLTQICFVEAFERLGELRDCDRFASWLYAIARHRCWDWMRRRSRRPALVADPSQLEADDAAELSTNPERQVLASARDEAIRGAVASLPPEYRSVVVLRYVGELSYAEIAEALGIKTSAVSMRWHRAKRMLREWLRETPRKCEEEVTS